MWSDSLYYFHLNVNQHVSLVCVCVSLLTETDIMQIWKYLSSAVGSHGKMTLKQKREVKSYFSVNKQETTRTEMMKQI